MLISRARPSPLPSGHQPHPKTCLLIMVALIDFHDLSIYVRLVIPKSAFAVSDSLLVEAHFQQLCGHLCLEGP